jgi:hypothetical protein
MEKLIVAVGKSNTGKTYALNVLIDEIKAKGYTFIDHPYSYSTPKDRGGTFEGVKLLDGSTVKIGIITQGDVADGVKEHIEDLDKEGCGIVITAAHQFYGYQGYFQGYSSKDVKVYLLSREAYPKMYSAEFAKTILPIIKLA